MQQCYLNGQKWNTDIPFYKTDVQTDFALKFIGGSQKNKTPFFLHLAYHAPHYPVQAKPQDIEKYKAIYQTKPQLLREKRYQNLRDLGLVSEKYALSPQVDKDNEWEQLSPVEREKYATVMATHAAMIDCIDQNIGRLITQLKEQGIYENTLITFSSDNGATPENGNGLWPGFIKERMGATYDENAQIGSEQSHWQIGYVWANVSNTPWREYKNNCHEGGLSSSFIVHWPNKIKAPALSHEKVFVWDFMPTWLEVAGASYPESYKQRPLKPLIGESFLPLLTGGKAKNQEREALFYFNNQKVLTYIRGDWKIVTEDYSDIENIEWELYNLAEDRTELNDLAKTKPEILFTMIAQFQNYLTQNTDPVKFNAYFKTKVKKKKKKSKK